jgi:NAD(P)-dependent dehydrogenase (short-subunit alcohol dehydrogenase family)
MRLAGKIAVVTGAGRGIGKAIALAMAKEGAAVGLADVDLAGCQKTLAEIKQSGGKGSAVSCDLSDKGQISDLVNVTLQTYGKLDILVNNAARASFKPFLRVAEEDWSLAFDTNLKGVFLISQMAAKAMIKNGKGRIINLASISSGLGNAFPLMSHYTASKGGVIGLTKAMAVELAPYDINVNAICPGAIDTGLLPSDMAARMVPRIPKGRLGKPEEVAGLAVFLASDEAEYITGSAIVIDGGWLSA